MKQLIALAAASAFTTCSVAQDLLWLHSNSVDWTMNYAMVNHQVDASPTGLVGGVRQFGQGMSFGVDVFNQVAVDWIDPATGIAFASCSMTDSVLMESMVMGDDGTIYVAGRFLGDIQFCDGNTLPGTGGFLDADLFVAAFSGTTFGLQWVKNVSTGHPNGQRVPALAIDANGVLWYGYEEFEEIHLISVDSQGSDNQELIITGTRVLGGFGFDADNNLYVTGSTGDNSGPLAFGGLSVTVPDPYDIFILRMNADGSGDWAQLAEAGTFHSPDVAVDPNGDAFISSAIMMATDLGGILLNGPNWVGDVFIAKVDRNGDFLWGRESAPASGPIVGDMAQSRMKSIDCDAAGNVYLTGTVRGQTQWGNGVVSDAITIGAYAQTVVAFDGSGTAQWAITSNPSSMNAQAVSCADDGTVFFTGHVLGPYTMGGETVNSGGMQAFVDGRIDGLNTQVSAAAPSTGSKAWPNPATDRILLEAMAGERYSIFSSDSRIVASGLLRPGINEIDLARLGTGVFTIRTVSGSLARFTKQ